MKKPVIQKKKKLPMASRKFIDSMNMLSGILKPHSDIIVTLELCIVNARAHKHTHAQLCICDIKKKIPQAFTCNPPVKQALSK